jgi:DNA polymerase
MSAPDNPPEIDATEAQSLLKWQVDVGADEAIEEAPVNRYVEQAAKAPAPKRAEPRPSSPTVASARDLARACASLSDLKTAIEGFEGCGLKHTAHSTVFADGHAGAPLMLIGEAPGRDEDRHGLPFVGRSGQLLDKMLAAIGRDRKSMSPESSVYITNILPWRPPGNRNPSPEEIALCLPFLERHIALVKPKVLVALGGVSAKQLLDTSVGIMKLRGRWGALDIDGAHIPCMPTFHPAYLLRQPGQKRYAWADLLTISDKLNET